MRREDDAAGVAGPMLGVETGVVFRQIRVAAVAEDVFDEIEVADEVARREKTDLHGFLRREAGHFGADDRPEQQRNKALGGLRLRGGERQAHDFARRIEGEAQQFSEHGLGHADFVVGNGQAAFRHVKDALGRAAVAVGIVQHALLDPVGIENAGGEFIAIHRQRQHARHAGTIQRQRAQRQFGHRHVLQIIVEEGLNPLVGGTKVIGQQSLLFPVLRNERGNDVTEFRHVAGCHRREAEQRQFDVDVGNQAGGRIHAASVSRKRMRLCTSVLME